MGAAWTVWPKLGETPPEHPMHWAIDCEVKVAATAMAKSVSALFIKVSKNSKLGQTRRKRRSTLAASCE